MKVLASVPERDSALLDPLRELGCATTFDNLDTISNTDVVVLGVKPFVIPLVAKELKNKGKGQLLISVAAGIIQRNISVTKFKYWITPGIDTQKIQSMFGTNWRMVRAMPNTAVTVGEGATVYCLGPGAEQSDGMIVQKLFSSVGYCARVQESQIGKFSILRAFGFLYEYIHF